jgi:hypothetical protein
MITRLIRQLGGNRGSEIAEAALVIPIAFLILLSIYWFGRAFNVYATINHAARQGVRAAIANTCGSCGNGSNISAIPTQVGQALQAAGMDPGLAISETVAHVACTYGQANQCSAVTGPPALWVCTNVQLVPPASWTQLQLEGGPGTPPCGVSVDFQYPYQMFLPGTILNNAPLKLSAHVQMRVEQ